MTSADHPLGPLRVVLADESVSELMINGPGSVWVERAGILERLGVSLDARAIGQLIEKVVAPLGLRADRSAPLVDARLADGSRLNAALPPLAVDGPYVTIRRFRRRPLPLDAFTSPDVAQMLEHVVRDRRNVVVTGATSSGKTTLLNALVAEIPAGERVITVEDAAELQVARDHIVRLEARPPNAEGAGGVNVRLLLRNALRMRPDRLVVGEVRDGTALDMLQALNTGHDGSMSTCHANSNADAVLRLETMAMMGGLDLPIEAIRRQLVAAIDTVVHVVRGVGGSRQIAAVAEVATELSKGRIELRPLAAGGRVLASPIRPARTSR